MVQELTGNCLVAQSGGPTSVINASLAGVINEALNHECIEEIYGAENGVLGILGENLLDLAEESQQAIRGLKSTPGSALGTCRYKLRSDRDFDRILEVFAAHEIRYFFYIGGNDSQDSAHRIDQLAKSRGYDLRVIGVPKTIDNDLVGTDHCPGYGSVAKYVATLVREMACDCRAMGHHDYVSILEVMGRSAGWIAAASCLAKGKDHPKDPPHLIYLPEVAFSPEKCVADVQRVLEQERFCLIVVGEGLVDRDGNYLTTTGAGSDAFGHAQLGGTGDYLRNLIEESLAVRARSAKLGLSQRSASHCGSATDNNEAEMAGRAAVTAAMNGESGKMVTLLRAEKDVYQCETGLIDLAEVANGVKKVPQQWINEDGISLSHQFIKYATPLIQGETPVEMEAGLPKFTELRGIRVQKLLSQYELEA